MSILFSEKIFGCDSKCIRKMIQDMMKCIKASYQLSDCEEYEFRLILNELIANGTVHGNKKLCDKSIIAQIEAVDESTVRITIKDEGSGFDYHSLSKRAYHCESNLFSERGRGLKLIKAMSNDIRFNHIGNQIQIDKTIE